jgi:hypothetical protein
MILLGVVQKEGRSTFVTSQVALQFLLRPYQW